MFKVEYKYSACIKIITDDTRILCDPWFGSSAYEGTWHHFPPVKDTIGLVGDFDLIYVSHIHPDHYCSETISELLAHYGNKNILIADWGGHTNYLARKMGSDGLRDNLLISNEITIGDTSIKVIPNSTGSLSDIDSALIVSSKNSKKAVLNVNDCIYNDSFYDKINEIKTEGGLEFTLFCLGYTGAGPYPQTYYSPILDEGKLLELASKKKQQFFDRYLKAISKIDSVKRLPFAGKYVLKGDLSVLNKYRGVADALEVKEFDGDAIVLDDGGDAYFDLESLKCSSERQERYHKIDYFPTDIDYNWRNSVGFTPSPTHLKRLLSKSISNAHPRSECDRDCFWSIYAYDAPSMLINLWMQKEPWRLIEPLATFNCNKNSDPQQLAGTPFCHSHLFIEGKALFAVLTGISHWNNYEVGSVFQVRRVPDVYVGEMQQYLNFLSVI